MELLANPLVERLGWTLLHSLWQGAAIALVYAAAAWWARRRGPELRYALSIAALAALALAPIATFAWLAPESAATPLRAQALGGLTLLGGAPLADAGEFDVAATLEPMLPWIVALWCTGVLVSALRVWGAWRHLVALRRSAAPLGGRELAELVARISGELGIDRAVRIARSTLVESPTVIGWFEPMILVPTAALAGLDPRQLAMILAHELAHIRRHDYLVNALQAVLETLLFFHPAVHWISARARQEREECCDAVAVRFGGDAIAYARALTELEELRGMRASLALAATGGVLLDRIERLLGRGRERQRGTALASACALATLTALTVTVGAPEFARDMASEGATSAEVVAPAVTVSAAPVPAVVDAARPARAPEQSPAPGAITESVAQTSPPAAPKSVDANPANDSPATDAPAADLPMIGGDTGAVATAPAEAQVAPATGALPLITGGERTVGAPPSYPYGARSRKISGTVTARLIVGADGRTQQVQVVSADPPGVFDRAVVRALSNWRFAPLYEDGRPVAREVLQELVFEPEAGECATVTGTRLCRKVGEDDRARDGVTIIRLR